MPSITLACLVLKTVSQGFFQHGGVSISTFVGWIKQVSHIPVEWALYPSQRDNDRAVGGPALDSGSENDIQPGRYVIRTLPPGEVSLWCLCPAGWLADRYDCYIESAQVGVYLTTDVARTRAYSVNHTSTPHVRFSGIWLALPDKSVWF
jgi:hypothetical protein